MIFAFMPTSKVWKKYSKHPAKEDPSLLKQIQLLLDV